MFITRERTRNVNSLIFFNISPYVFIGLPVDLHTSVVKRGTHVFQLGTMMSLTTQRCLSQRPGVYKTADGCAKTYRTDT